MPIHNRMQLKLYLLSRSILFFLILEEIRNNCRFLNSHVRRLRNIKRKSFAENQQNFVDCKMLAMRGASYKILIYMQIYVSLSRRFFRRIIIGLPTFNLFTPIKSFCSLGASGCLLIFLIRFSRRTVRVPLNLLLALRASPQMSAGSWLSLLSVQNGGFVKEGSAPPLTFRSRNNFGTKRQLPSKIGRSRVDCPCCELAGLRSIAPRVAM